MQTKLRAVPTMSAVDKAMDLQRQAESAARAIANEVLLDLELIRARCEEASELTAVMPGIRDILRKQAESIQVSLNTVSAIRGRE
jgi:hypothetical protein